ncbi:MAG: hypothetical protein ACE5LL_03905 [Alphaproteobacteria bacterium]
MRRRARVALLALAAVGLAATTAAGRPVTVGGVTFSDERGGFSILAAWGSGSLDDPFVLLEEITQAAGVTLVIRGLDSSVGNPLPTFHAVGFALRKVVTNRSGQVWTFFDHELQHVPGRVSDTYDGLSFGQAAETGRPFRSDRYARSAVVDEPGDVVSFYDGVVGPGETVIFEFVITGTTGQPEFYLAQRPNLPIAAVRGRRPGGA